MNKSAPSMTRSPFGAWHHNRAAEGKQGRGVVARGVGVSQRTADGAAMADLGVADLAGGVGQQRGCSTTRS